MSFLYSPERLIHPEQAAWSDVIGPLLGKT